MRRAAVISRIRENQYFKGDERMVIRTFKKKRWVIQGRDYFESILILR